jgi:hypothetical protein
VFTNIQKCQHICLLNIKKVNLTVYFEVFCQIKANGSAMVSTGIKSSEFPIKHLAKTFYFVLSFHF